MTRSHRLLLTILTAAGMAAPVLAQHDATKPDAKPAPKKDQPPAGMPDMTDEQKKMMEMYMAAAQPGKMHEYLAQSVGTWEGKVTMWEPGAPAQESACTSKTKKMMDGRFVRTEVKGNMMGMPFEGFGLYGYDNTSKKFQATWCDNMGTGMMTGTGDLGADGKTLTWTMSFNDPATGKPTTMREIDKHTADGGMTLEMYGPDPKTGKEYKMMEIKFTRKDKGDADDKSDAKHEGKEKEEHADHKDKKKDH